MELNEIERRVLEMILDGDHPIIAQLRQQLACCQVVNREWTGSGFFTELGVARDCDAADTKKDSIHFGDVAAEVESVRYGMGFLMKVVSGCLGSLEGYTFEEPCRENPRLLELRYTEGGQRDFSAFDQE